MLTHGCSPTASMHLRSLSLSPILPASTAPPPPSPDSTTTFSSHARLESAVSRQHPTSTESPRTPPSTPIPTTFTSQPTTMWALTASKLERAAQAQLTGSRGSSGLRELVLLSNVWGAARPLWDQEQAERERIERRRKEDEERWLDGVLEEMLEEEEGDEDFVSLTLVEREREEVGDSGFLEEEGQGWQVKKGREDLRAIEEEEDSNAEAVDLAATDYPLPPSPPLPPRSPPIDLPSSNQHHLSFSFDLSSSPPLHLPALTPDSTPPNPSSFSSMLSTSADSVDSDLEDSYQWVQERDQRLGLGLRALDLSPPSQKKRGGGEEGGQSLDMLTISHGLHHSSSFADETVSFPFGPERAPPPPTTSLALTLTAAHHFQTQGQNNWTPRPPRSLSLPSLRAKAASFIDGTVEGGSRPTFFAGGIGKSFYDCVE